MTVNLHQNHTSKVIEQINISVVVRVVEERDDGEPFKVARGRVGSNDHLGEDGRSFISKLPNSYVMCVC